MNPLGKYRERTRQKLLDDFGAFCRRAWKEIEPGKSLEWNWHHELICEYLMLAYQREELRLIFCMPPRGLKSKLISVFLGAWVWAKSPHESFILCSYSDSLSEELNMARRTLLQSKWFQETFPGKVLFTPDQNRREQYKNMAGGQAIATSVEGSLTGKGADYLLIDDLLSPQQSYSDLERANANRFFDSTLRSRLNEPERGAIIVVCQRLHEVDLPGHLNENEPGVWTAINLPMECERDEEIVLPISGRVIHRAAGDLLHPARWPQAWCTKTKATVGSFIWASQYQQRPAPAGGAIFRSEWFQNYKKEPDKGQTIISLDTAYSVKKTADFSAASVWTAQEGRYYLRFVWRGRVEYPQLKRMAEELYDVWHPESVVIEEKASGQSLLQSLKQETSLPVLGVPADVDKISRAHPVTALFESGRVYFPENTNAPWMAAYLHELELFPAGAHDDMVDTTTMALRYLRGRQYDGGLGFIDTLKGYFSGKRKLPATPAEILQSAPPGKTQTRVEGWKRWVEEGKAPPCPHKECKNTCTAYMPDADGKPRIFCRQCARFDGQEHPAAIGTCCADFLPQMISGCLRCGNCGWQKQTPVIAGVSRTDASGVGKRGIYGRFG